MVAANGQRDGPSLHDLAEKITDVVEGTVQIDRIYRGIAQIRNTANFIRRNFRDRVDALDQTGHFADLARAVAGSRAVRRAAIPGNADDGNIHFVRIRHNWKTHECGVPGKSRSYAGVDGLKTP